MKFWPVPESYLKEIPRSGPGSFAENRGDRNHCGVDIYAPSGSKVLSTEEGVVIAVGKFTSPEIKTYWNTTYFVAIKHASGYTVKYCELGMVYVSLNERVEGGQIIGNIGKVLCLEKINKDSPLYIQKSKEAGIKSMLHFELYEEVPVITESYTGGNWFDSKKPPSLLDPTEYLSSLNK